MPEETTETAPAGAKVPWRLAALVLALATLWWVIRKTDLMGHIPAVRRWIEGQGAAAPVVYVLLRAAAAVALVPGMPISAAARVLFGAFTAVVCISAGSTLGATIPFLISRYWARGSVVRWLGTRKTFQRIDRLVARHGALVVALMRLLPVVPFNVQNYAFGLTRIPFGTYVFWSWLCMLPGTLLAVVSMDVILRTLAEGKVPWGGVALLAVTVMLIVALAVWAFLKLRVLGISESQQQ